jgi:predicted GTPase
MICILDQQSWVVLVLSHHPFAFSLGCGQVPTMMRTLKNCWVLVNQVGSGKSSLLGALLGEMHRLHGELHIDGDLALVAQVWTKSDLKTEIQTTAKRT